MVRINCKIDLSKIDKSRLIEGKTRENGQKSRYANINVYPAFKNDTADFNVTQTVDKATREKESDAKRIYLGKGMFDLFSDDLPSGAVPNKPVISDAISLSIDMTKIKPERITVSGEKKYYEFTLQEHIRDEFGNNFRVVERETDADRKFKKRTEIIGNGKTWEDAVQQMKQTQTAPPVTEYASDAPEGEQQIPPVPQCDDLPF